MRLEKMKKIPTLFTRVYQNHKIVDCLPIVAEGMEWVLDGKGIATVKYDGSCCAIINREFYKRYDAKKGKPVPDGAIKCQEKADEITGHLPCWVKCDRKNPSDKWFWSAYDSVFDGYGKDTRATLATILKDARVKDIPWTFEAVGKHFNGNPYGIDNDILVEHGKDIVDIERTFDGIKNYLKNNYIEGIVFWLDGEPKCKVKRTDFGFDWN